MKEGKQGVGGRHGGCGGHGEREREREREEGPLGLSYK